MPAAIHRATGTPELRVWHHIRDRTLNPRCPYYKDYGGRGIKLHGPWRESFVAFLDYVVSTIGLRPGPEYSLDRKDNNGNYEPGNIRWATAKEQAANKRPRSKFPGERVFRGKTQNLNAWAKEYGINVCTLRTRIYNQGWPIEKALTTPVRQLTSSKGKQQ